MKVNVNTNTPNTDNDRDFYKLSGNRLEKDHHPHSPKTTFEFSTVAIALFVAFWIGILMWLATMVSKTS
jgi:hypothetical protein